MSIKKVGPKGIYWCSFYPAPGEKRVRQSLRTTDKREARELEARLILDAKACAKAKRKDGTTLAEAYRHAMRVRDDWRSAKRPDSIQNVYNAVASHFGENCPLSKLDDDAVLDYGEELFEEGLAPSTINKRFSIISVLFDETIKRDNSREGIRSSLRRPYISYYKVNNKRKRLITVEEETQVIQILKASDSPYETAMADLVAVLADTGMRLSEALNLKPVDVNQEHKAVLVTKTKNDEDRAIPLTARAFDILVRRISCDPIFHPLTKSAASHIWRRVRAKMGLANEPEFVLHGFRHTFGSTLANAGVDAFRIQKVMGHKSLTTTQGYVKVTMAGLVGLSDIMENRTKGKHFESPPKSS
ncbi:hypothetical protein EBAPG3_009400 [Nitrosospira lacus]|uniref:Tyr recombinase domain-containing protein n=1 Tax=Nitrosospira lacus TaxID=1288494 RepID=A0A1W6SQ69_9PROT|nr:site-specific integrase [Nitrosospira lacus]ARO87964.1 hypothetical protein EBAPG3_009400 [Nitrosospira lacus]